VAQSRPAGPPLAPPPRPTRPLPQTALREATDARLFREVIDLGRATRAELAASTSTSKPTVSESIRRLVAAGLVAATGLQETGRRGRIGTFYELGPVAGWVLALVVDQDGVRARSADLSGRSVHELERPPGPPGDTRLLVEAMRSTCREAMDLAAHRRGPLRAVAISVANPVHPVSHDVIALPDSPFPEGLVNPGEALRDVVRAPVLVDNDVNLAALAEHQVGAGVGVGSFAYVYVGGGLGVGLYLGDQLVRGAHGLAGEIAYLPGTRTPAGPGSLDADLRSAGLERGDAPSIDVAAVVRLLDRPSSVTSRQGRLVRVLSDAIARSIASISAVVDPELVLLGGPIGTHPAFLPLVQADLAGRPGGTPRLVVGALGKLAPLHGATLLAADHARATAIAGAGP
jgi:predicted NBD/HSP70 family sugar kinase